MKIGFFYYDGFAEFEISLACLLLHKEDLVFIGKEKKVYRSEEKQRFLPDTSIEETNVDEFDALIIPGGNPNPLFGDEAIAKFVDGFAKRGKLIAGICGGAVFMAQLGLLDGKFATGNTSGITEEDPDSAHYKKAMVKDEFVVVDGNIITAQGQAFAEFAVEIARKIGIIKGDEEYQDTLHWVKNIR